MTRRDVLRCGTSAAICTGALVLFVSAGGSTVTGPDVYVDATLPVESTTEFYVDVVVGNRGTTSSRSNFDTFLEVTDGDRTICTKSTNFLTPLDPGQSISTFRFRLTAARSSSGKLTRYILSTHAHYWDEETAGDSNRRNNQVSRVLVWPAGATAQCTILKPLQ